MANQKTLIKFILPIIILIIGLIVMKGLISQHEAPEKTKRVNPGALVQLLDVKRTSRHVEVVGTGTVLATEEVSVALQVSGRVTEMAPNFATGGFFKAGELMFAVDTADYKFALQQAKATLAKAKSGLLVAESKAKIARQEWQRLHPDSKEQPNPLVIHEPQLQEAKANLIAAKSSLKQARLNLTRTRMTAPFNCRIRSEHIGPGQFIRSGEIVAVISSIDEVEITVPLSLQELNWLAIPTQPSGKAGSPANVLLTSGTTTHEWQGEIVRSLGEADPKDRMVPVIVRVKNPYESLLSKVNSKPDLIPGSYVDVVIRGTELTNIVILPITAQRDNSTVWIMDHDKKLRIRKVQTIRQTEDSFWVSNGLENGAQVIVTTLSGGSDGMLLRPMQQEESGE